MVRFIAILDRIVRKDFRPVLRRTAIGVELERRYRNGSPVSGAGSLNELGHVRTATAVPTVEAAQIAARCHHGSRIASTLDIWSARTAIEFTPGFAARHDSPSRFIMRCSGSEGSPVARGQRVARQRKQAPKFCQRLFMSGQPQLRLAILQATRKLRSADVASSSPKTVCNVPCGGSRQAFHESGDIATPPITCSLPRIGSAYPRRTLSSGRPARCSDRRGLAMRASSVPQSFRDKTTSTDR